jgi:hypothetical protein
MSAGPLFAPSTLNHAGPVCRRPHARTDRPDRRPPARGRAGAQHSRSAVPRPPLLAGPAPQQAQPGFRPAGAAKLPLAAGPSIAARRRGQRHSPAQARRFPGRSAESGWDVRFETAGLRSRGRNPPGQVREIFGTARRARLRVVHFLAVHAQPRRLQLHRPRVPLLLLLSGRTPRRADVPAGLAAKDRGAAGAFVEPPAGKPGI